MTARSFTSRVQIRAWCAHRHTPSLSILVLSQHVEHLYAREHEVLGLMAEGRSNAAIGATMVVGTTAAGSWP